MRKLRFRALRMRQSKLSGRVCSLSSLNFCSPPPRTDPPGYPPFTGLEPWNKWLHPSCLLSGLVPLHHLQGPSQYKCLRLWSQSFPGSTVVKKLPSKAGDTGDAGSVPGWGRSSGGGNGNPLQYSCLENPMDKGAKEPSGLQSIGSQRVRHDWAMFTCHFPKPEVRGLVT